jgi:type IV fimbrial biogenesis protein FimT
MTTAGPMARRERGFTLIELMITITVMSVLLVVVAPSFQSAMMSNRLSSYANDWAAAARLAKGEAIKRGVTLVAGVPQSTQVLLCRSSDGAACATSGTWQQGWIVCVDANSNNLCDSGETILSAQSSLSSDYHFTSTSYTLAFQPTGMVTSGTTLTLCRATPSPGNQERQILLLTTGKVYVSTTRTGTCT